jgi:hypothetical protein
MKKHLKHVGAAVLEGGLIAVVAVVLVAGSAFAGKPGSTTTGGGGGNHGGGGTTGGSGTVALVLVNDANGNGAANWGDSVTYTVATSATAYPYVSTQCTQNGSLVLSTSAGWFASYAWPGARTVPLATDAWTGGAATCTAKLYSMDSGSPSTISTLTFAVGA